jgi:protein SCO1/2
MTMRNLVLSLTLLLAAGAGAAASDPTPLIRGHFDLKDARSGARATQANYAGRYRLVFFGFTHCPLTCPLGLRTLEKVLAKLGPDAAKLQCLFITLDPERDDAAAMRAFLASYDPRITGLVGTPKAVHAAMRDFRLEAERIGGAGGYLLEHPAIAYLMGQDGSYLKTLSVRGDPAELAAQVRAAMANHPPKAAQM